MEIVGQFIGSITMRCCVSKKLVWLMVAWVICGWFTWGVAGAAPLPQSGTIYHTVQPNENLYRISLRYGVTILALMQANGISDPNRVYVGQQLAVPSNAVGELPPAPQPAPETPIVEPGATTHTVQPGENLYRIGLRYGVTAQSLAWANGLANVNMVYVGQTLVVPAAGSAPAVTPPPSLAPASPSTAGKYIVVVLSEQRVYAYENGQLARTMLVSTGIAAYPTVTGNYSIYLKYTSQLMTGPGYYLPNVPYVMYFYKGYSFHGTYWHNNFGQPMSHGCVNMLTSDAAWLYNWAPIGTSVTVRY